MVFCIGVFACCYTQTDTDEDQETRVKETPPVVTTTDSRKVEEPPKDEFEVSNPCLGFKPITEYRRKDLEDDEDEDDEACNSEDDDDSSDSSEDEIYSRRRRKEQEETGTKSECKGISSLLNSFGGSLPQLSPSSTGTSCALGLPGTMFRLGFLGSLEVEEEVGFGRRRRKRAKKDMVEEAVMKLKVRP